MNPITGLIVVDKPAGITSHDVVDRIRKAYGLKKVGHGGTLDPAATGVLLVGLGKGTRLLHFLVGLPKTYVAEVAFGVTTTTLDAEGEVTGTRPCDFDRARLDEAAAAFTGEITQVPPMFSAVKVGGEPLYKAARRGEEVTRPPRHVTIHQLDVTWFDPARFRAGLEVRCSSGTYIRTLAADLGERLGCGAHLASLRRTAVGSFTESEALSLEQIEAATPQQRARMVMPPGPAMRDFPGVAV
jgi:tRNA pseudouridine55 synthase